MTWIKTIEPSQAEGDVEEFYRRVAAARGGVAAIHRAQSLHPRAMRAHLELYKSILFARASLGRIERERIAIVVSRANDCDYCVAHHAEALRQLGDDPEVVRRLSEGETDPGKSVPDAELLTWCRQGALSPAGCDESAIEHLREHGWEDRAILDAALTTAYFCFVNRLVLMLGVELEAGFEETCAPELSAGAEERAAMAAGRADPIETKKGTR